MKNLVLSALALATAAGSALAQTPGVEFQIVERRGQTAWNLGQASSATNDNVLDFAVRARVTGGTNVALGNFNFNIATTNGESESFGTLNKVKISTAGTGAYDNGATTGFANNATVGQGGLAASYSYLAGINGAFNGVLNTSSGTYTNNPAEQDVGLVTGAPIGGALLTTFGAAGNTDDMGNPVPDSWTSGDTAPLDPTLANTYLGANGNWVNLYRFKYTINAAATNARTISFQINGVAAQVFTGLSVSNGVWGPSGISDVSPTIDGPATVQVIPVPAPASAALLGLGGLVAARRRRVTA